MPMCQNHGPHPEGTRCSICVEFELEKLQRMQAKIDTAEIKPIVILGAAIFAGCFLDLRRSTSDSSRYCSLFFQGPGSTILELSMTLADSLASREHRLEPGKSYSVRRSLEASVGFIFHDQYGNEV